MWASRSRTVIRSPSARSPGTYRSTGSSSAEHSGLCKAQRQRCDERLCDASNPEARIGRGVAGSKLAHVGSLPDANEHAWHTTRDKLICGLLESRRRIAKQECSDRHKGGRRESCEPEPAHPALNVRLADREGDRHVRGRLLRPGLDRSRLAPSPCRRRRTAWAEERPRPRRSTSRDRAKRWLRKRALARSRGRWRPRPSRAWR